MKKYRNKAFRFNQDIDNAYRRLFGPEPAGCVICGEDEPELLDIHEADDSLDFKVLCSSCHRGLPSISHKKIGEDSHVRTDRA